MRRVRQAAALRHAPLALAPAHQAALEPERAARAGDGGRHTQARQRVHVVPEGRQGHQGLSVQGVVKLYDPNTGEGVVTGDTDRAEYVFAEDALQGSLFRILRQGQRITFELNGRGQATTVRVGSEPDMGLSTA